MTLPLGIFGRGNLAKAEQQPNRARAEAMARASLYVVLERMESGVWKFCAAFSEVRSAEEFVRGREGVHQILLPN